MKQSNKGHIALLFTNLLFAANFTVVKFLVNNNYVQAFGINFLRASVTAILLWMLFIFKPTKITIQKKHWGRLILCALTGIAVNQLMFIKGLSLTSSIHASLLLLTTPILITIIAAVVLKEKITPSKVIGLALGITGAFILILNKQNGNEAKNMWVGDVLVLLNAISYTCYFILVKPLMKEYRPIVILRIIFTIGFVMMIPFCWGEFNAIEWNTFSPKVYMALALIVVGGTFFAYLLNIYGLKTLGASISGSYIYLQPIFASIIAISIGGESLETYKIIAACIIFIGVYLVNKQTNE